MPSKVDKTVCRHCKLAPPHIQMLYVRDKPRGECIECRRALRQRDSLKKHAFTYFYNNLSNLTAINFKLLASLSPGAYPLLDRSYKAPAGYFAILRGYFYVYLWDKDRLIERDLYGFSTWLSNQNLVIDPAPIVVNDPTGAVVELETLHVGMIPTNIQDLLVMYDVKLQDYAVKRLRDEINKEKKKSKRE